MNTEKLDLNQTAEMTGEDIAKEITKRSKTGLRPCPFCGSISLSMISFREGLALTIECSDCGATGPNAFDDRDDPNREERLRLLWDTRREEV